MKSWQQFEQDCLKYLQKTYGNKNVRFEADGGSDSGAPDIRVYINNVNKFNIEVKDSKAQSGQFVVLIENDHFVFSAKNKSNEEDALPFLEYMNANFESYKNVSTSGIDLEMDKNEFNSWIVKHYLDKNETFVITRGIKGYIIFPTEKYASYFDTSSNYRIKDSGSTNPPKKYLDSLKNYFSPDTLEYRGKYLVLKTNKQYKNKERHVVDNQIFLISENVEDGYKITKKGKTKNPNVIFTIKLKQQQVDTDLFSFEEALKE